jgi:hypothetical protein
MYKEEKAGCVFKSVILVSLAASPPFQSHELNQATSSSILNVLDRRAGRDLVED